MVWSIRSPNMSPIWHLWDVVEMSIYVQNGALRIPVNFGQLLKQHARQRFCLISTLHQAIGGLSQY